jgi:putative oxidoreductase
MRLGRSTRASPAHGGTGEVGSIAVARSSPAPSLQVRACVWIRLFELRNQASSRRWALVPLRLVIGAGFMAHGWAKWSRGPAGFANLLHQVGVPLPALTAWAVTILEVFSGLAILVGAFVAIASAPLILNMLVAMFTVQLRYGFSSVNTIGLTPSGPVFGPPGYEINLLYIAGLLAFIVDGAGALSVDEWFGRRYRARDSAARP